MKTVQKIVRLAGVGTQTAVIVGVVLSISASQVFAPAHFTALGQHKSTLTAFLRAAVKMGDSYLIKQVFHDSLVTEYPVVFDAYLQESEWVTRLRSIETRSPLSRDVLATLAILEDRMGNQSKAAEYRENIKSIDPMYETSTGNIQ